MQRGFEKNPNRSPKRWQDSLKLGKVIGARPEDKTVDIVMIDGGATHYNVPVLAPMASTSSGLSHLPKPQNPKANTEEGYDWPVTYGGRDIFAIIGFVEGIGTMPIVLGFRYPAKNQLSFPDSAGANQYLDRHESDRYHRITGDTVAENGGADISGEEEIRYPDNSYFKVVKSGGSRDLEDLSAKNQDTQTPFTVKKEDRKGFYFQHASGTRVFIGHDGEIKIGHHGGSWVSIGPDIGELPAAQAAVKTINSKNDPPAAANSSPVKMHIEHSSGARITIDTSGKIEITGVATVEIAGADGAPVKGVIQGDCICALTGQPHIMTSSNVKASV